MSEPKRPDGWAWCIDGAESAHGPFPTRAEAIADAAKHGDGRAIVIGTVRWAVPSEHVQKTADDMLEDMELQASDNDFGFADGDVFDLRTADSLERANQELGEFLRRWADRWFVGTAWAIEPEGKDTAS